MRRGATRPVAYECALERHGRQTEAMEAYRQALQMNPRHFQAENHLNQIHIELRGAHVRIEGNADPTVVRVLLESLAG